MDQALNGVFFQGGIPAARELFIAPAMERIIVRPVSSWAEFTRLRHNTASAAVGCDGPVPGLSSRAVGATPNKPTSLGLANFQQAKPEKEPNLPLSPSLEAWLPVQAQALEGRDTGMHEGTGGAPITGTSFGPITRENSRKAIKNSRGLVRNRCRPLGHAHRTMGVQDPLCNAAATETSGTGDHIPQGVPKVVISARAAEQGSDRAGSTHPRLLQPLVPCSQGNRGMEADHRSVLPQCLRASVNPQGPTTGPVVNLPRPERCLLSYRDRPSRQTLPALLSQRHRLAIFSTAIRVVNQSESIYQNTQTCTSICPSPSGKIAHVHR